MAGDYDVSLLDLITPVDLSPNTVNPACMPVGAGLDDFVGDNCYATGFGSTAGGYVPSVYQLITLAYYLLWI